MNGLRRLLPVLCGVATPMWAGGMFFELGTAASGRHLASSRSASVLYGSPASAGLSTSVSPEPGDVAELSSTRTTSSRRPLTCG